MTENIIVSIQHALDEEKLHDYLIKVAGDHLKLPLERGYVKIGDKNDVYGCVFDPTAKTLEVRHRYTGWFWDKTATILRLSVFIAPQQMSQKPVAKGWGSPAIDEVQ